MFQTYSDPHFMQYEDKSLSALFRFHTIYPQEIVIFLLTIFIPALYYGFIRGIKFYEKGVIFNRGLPFFNTVILYKDIEKYEIIHPKYLVSITERSSGDDHLFGVEKIDRVIAIFDQSGIKGEFESANVADHKAKKKLILIIVLFGILAALVQHFGVIRFLFR